MAEQRHIIGLVAIGRNEGDRLKRCLRSIPANIPAVYVDSASTDDSVAFARSVGASVVELDMALPFTAARARNEGADELLRSHPKTEYIQFVDGDCELEAEWFATAENFLSADSSIAAVCGRRRERFPSASFYNRMCDAEWNTPIGEADACGGDAMLRTTAFSQVGGYDPSMIAGEEPELCQRLRGAGWRIWRLDAPMTIHDADMHRTAQWWRRAVRSGFGYAQVWRKTEASGRDILYRREVISALGWTFGVILVALLAAIVFGPAGTIVAPIIWVAQLVRLAVREGFTKGSHLLLGKIAETLGILRFAIGSVRGRKQGAIFYK
ncbi:MAG: glycosyltransferase [Parasphingorhabdus sp.]|uniref:glycosyltransferase n=1 Tax=Parasphingorhabdus sp. TaxID=2709688 RepID=UPI0030014C0E